jgi:hypothetical protein
MRKLHEYALNRAKSNRLLVLRNAEEYYPRLFRVVSGDGVLAALSGGARESATA